MGKSAVHSLAHGSSTYTWVACNTLKSQHVTRAKNTMETNDSPFAFNSS